MGRTTVYNNLTTPEQIDKISEENKYLMNEFLEYLRSVDRAESTIKQYSSDLKIFFVWDLEKNNNKNFVDIKKREFAKFQSYAINDLGWSPKRIRRVKATISSMSNFIENIMDEEDGYENYRSIIKKIESPANETVREKTVFEKEELQKLLDYLVENKKYMKACVVALAMYSGRRKAELPRFKTEFFADENIIFGSLYKTPEKVKTKGRGTKGKLLNLYVLKNQFDPYLKLWMDYRNENNIDSIWLFPNRTNYEEPISTDSLDDWVDEFTNVIGKDFYWHALRHFFTTELAKANLPTNVIQDIVGWSSLDMVGLYTDLSADENIGKYFDENGIKNVEQGSLDNL